MSLAIIQAIAFLIALGYAQNYYFHLRKSINMLGKLMALFSDSGLAGHHKNHAH
jgi:hypothetical protein